MGALNSLAIWGSLAALGVAVPIIIHLLYRKHRKQTDWAAMELLKRALVIRSGQVKLEDYLILFLRCLALLLLAIALLRPTNSNSSGLGKKRVGMVVAIDASFSMNHGAQPRFERAIAKAREIFGTASAGDTVSLVLMSNQPEVLMRGADYVKNRVSALLDEQTTTPPYRLSLAQNLEKIEEMVGELKTAGKEVFLITDSQESDWATINADSSAAFERLSASANVFVIPVGTGTDGEENLSVESLTYTSGTLRPDGDALFTAMVRNEGRHRADAGTLEFYLDGKLGERRTVGSLEAGEARGVEFYPPFDQPGEIRLMAKLANDDLSDDNVRHAVAKIRSGISVLCVEGSSPVENTANRTGGYYAVRALRLKDRGLESPVLVTQIEAPDLSQETLRDFDAIILANVADLAPETVDRLRTYVRRGGGLLIATGDRVNAREYNERFGTDAEGLLPAELIETVEAEGEGSGWTLGPVKSDHLLAGLVGRLDSKLLDTARYRVVTSSRPTSGETILTVAELGVPLLLGKDLGSGSILLLTSSLDKTWNNLPIHPLFPMLVQQAVTMFTSDPDALQLTVGHPVDLAVSGREVNDTVTITNPTGSTADLRVTQSGEQPVAAIGVDSVGVYAIAGNEQSPSVVVAANPDPAESNVKIVDSSVLDSQLSPLGVKVLAKDGIGSNIVSARRGTELAHILLWLALIVFVLQSILAKHFTNKMDRDEGADLTATLQMSKVAAARRS